MEPLLEEKILTKVEDLMYYSNFSNLFKDVDIKYLADVKISKEKLKKDLEIFYTIEKQKKYGVVAIKIKKV